MALSPKTIRRSQKEFPRRQLPPEDCKLAWSRLPRSRLNSWKEVVLNARNARPNVCRSDCERVGHSTSRREGNCSAVEGRFVQVGVNHVHADIEIACWIP